MAGYDRRLRQAAAIIVLSAAGLVASALALNRSVPGASPGPVDLLVDANRDGRLTDDDRDMGARAAGRRAILPVNLDDDDRDGHPDTVTFDSTGRWVSVDRLVNGPAVEADIIPILIRHPPKSTLQALGARVFLAIEPPEAVGAVQVFGRIVGGARAIWGGPGDDRARIDVTSYLSDPRSAEAETTLGIEGLFFRYTVSNAYGLFPHGFDGLVRLRIEEILSDGRVAFRDKVALEAAPFIMLPTTQRPEAVWAAEESVGRSSNTAFLDELEKGADPTPLNTFALGDGTRDVDRWAQDHVEIGYSQAPGLPAQQVLLRLPYGQIPEWPERELLGPNVGIFQLGGLDSLSGNYGGNLEVLPPSPTHPLGRVVVGSTVQRSLLQFFQDQRVQSPIVVDTSWLTVGHVDEVLGFLPKADSAGFSVVVGSPSLAFCTLQAASTASSRTHTGRPCPPSSDLSVSPAAVLFASTGRTESGSASDGSGRNNALIDEGRDFREGNWRLLRIYAGPGAGQVAHIAMRFNGYVVVDRVWYTGLGAPRDIARPLECGVSACVSNTWYQPPSQRSRYVLVEGSKRWDANVPAIVTAYEIQHDEDLLELNYDIESRIDAIVRQLELHAAISVIRLPLVYTGRLTPDGHVKNASAMSYTPMLVNFQVLNDTVLLPRQFGPPNAHGADAFESLVRRSVPDAVWLDEWAPYHRIYAGIHCATNVLRRPFSFPWWRASVATSLAALP